DAPHLDLDHVAAGDQHTGTAAGNEDTAIALDVEIGRASGRESANISVTTTGVPASASLSAGTDNGRGSWTLTPAELSGLTLTSDGEVQSFTLNVAATTTDGGSAITATTSGTIGVTVTPVADAPHLDLDHVAAGDQHTGTAAGNEDTAIALDVRSEERRVGNEGSTPGTITSVT